MTDAPQAAPRSVVNILDATLVISALAIVAGVIAVLAFVHVPQENLPILASMASSLLGMVIGGYVGFRWAASEASKRAPGPSSTVSVTTGDPDAPTSATASL